MSRRSTTKEDIKAVITLYKAKHKVSEIVTLTGMCKRSVQRFIKKFKDSDETLTPVPKPKTGRPKLISRRTGKVLNRQVSRNPRSTARELKETNPHLLGNVSVRSIQQFLHDDLGYRSYRARRKPLLTAVQKAKRLKFAEKYSVWSDEDWRGVLWSDEATFTVTGSQYDRVYRRPHSDALDPKFTTKTVKHPDSVMVWGCFSYYGVGSLVVLPKNIKVNQGVYLELLCDHLPDSFEKTQARVSMQDGAPCHTAKAVVTWLDDCMVNYFKDWPGNSPDINPVENLWSIIKRGLRDLDTSSVPKLTTAIQQLWATIPQSHMENLADSVPRRLQEVIKRKGNTTKY